MSPRSVPDDVRRMLEERTQARDARDWDSADDLRDRIAAMGWEVQDGPRGSTARPLLPPEAAPTGYADPADLATLLDEPPAVTVSVQIVADDHADDLRRALAGLGAHPPGVDWELVVVSNAPSFELDPVIDSDAPIGATVLRTSARLGWADSRTIGMRRSRGKVTVLLDASVEPTGDFSTPLLAAFEDPSVGLAGGWGVTSGDGRSFEEAAPGEVDAIEGYVLAVRREALRAVGGFDRRFRYYRNADLDFSFAVRDAGWRAIRTQPLPVVRHEHRGWTSVSEKERDRLSKRNFYRFLDRWGDRPDMLLHPTDE